MRLRQIQIFMVMLLCGISSLAHANSFLVASQGAKAMGMGDAFVAVSDDPSANWYNPAGLSYQDNASAVGVLLGSDSKAYELSGVEYAQRAAVQVLPRIYSRYGLEESNLAIGIGVNAPFYLNTDWSESSAPFADVMANSDSVTLSQIQVIHINPNMAYRLNDYLSLAFGAGYYNAYKVHLDSQQLRFGGSGEGFGANAALLMHFENWSAGLSYRSSVKVDVRGTVAGGPALQRFGLENIGAKASASFVLPDMLALGMSYKPMDSMTFSFQLEKVNWSVFDDVQISHDPSVLDPAVGGTSTTVPFYWKSRINKRVGFEWRVTEASGLRLGYAAIPVPLTQAGFSPRSAMGAGKVMSLGYGVTFFDVLTMDLAYSTTQYNDYNARKPAKEVYQGLYLSSSRQFAAELAYRF